MIEGRFAIPMRHKSEVVDTAGPLQIVSSETGETMDVAEIRKRKVVDTERFVKLFVGQLDAFFDLKPGTVKLMTALIDELSQARYMNGDTIYLNYNRVTEYFEKRNSKPPAKATFFSAMSEMTEKGFVAPSVDTNLWFVNPAIFFNGDRVRFVTELRRKRTTTAQRLEAAGQQILPLNHEDE
ncbi:MAG: hypothetical protein LAT81_15420 [Oceanicaulis sp.]|nr:hypothetical protein [Oceanicaulis sp.]